MQPKEIMIESYNPPFRTDGDYIYDSNENIILEVKGWGHLMKPNIYKNAVAAQSWLVEQIVDFLNVLWRRND